MSGRLRRFTRWWQVLTIAAVAAAMFAGFDAVRLAWARSHQSTGSAEWIWGRRLDAPTAYFLVRDFSLDGGVDSAELQILADESYTAYLNGTRIGSNRYRAHSPVDRYEVGHYLRTGNNRIAVHVELTRLRGGLLARIVEAGADEESRELVVSDDSWSVLPEFPGERLGDPDFQLRPLPRAHSLGRSPRGRWGWLELGEQRTVLEDHLLTDAAGRTAPAARARWFRDQTGTWSKLPTDRSRNRRLGNWVELSWDEPQTGYFGIRYRSRKPPVGLVYFGMEPPNPAVQAPDLILVGVEQRPTWEDTVVRRFQYALVLGVPSLIDGQVHRVKVDNVEVWDQDSVGVRGIQPPPAGSRLRSAAEDEIWRRLQGLSRDTGG